MIIAVIKIGINIMIDNMVIGTGITTKTVLTGIILIITIGIRLLHLRFVNGFIARVLMPHHFYLI